MPQGHLPVRSYLAVSVVSRSGHVLGGLFFGHQEIGVFTEREEEIVVGLAAQAAIAIDNANLYRKSQDAVKARDEFLSICSHELKTPLTSLQLEAQIAQRLLNRQGEQALTPERFKDLIKTTMKQTSSLTSLVDDMLDVGRISTGRLKIRPEKMDVKKFIKECIEQIEPQYKAQGVELVSLLSDVDCEVTWDRQRISQIISNLLSNALKYGQRKPVECRLKCSSYDVQIFVKDQGLGISPENQARIFDRFERVSQDRNISGLGLGLYISKKLIESHKGQIQLRSELGKGSEFMVSLPKDPAYRVSQLENDTEESSPSL